MLQIYPTLRPCNVKDVYSDILLPRKCVLMNFVTTVDGRAALGGTSQRIGSRTDHFLMRRLRSLVDAVVTGSGTLEREGIDPGVPPQFVAERTARGLAPQPLSVLLAGRNGVRLRGRLSGIGPNRLIIFAPETVPDPPESTQATVYRCPGKRPAPGDILNVLAERHGANRILLEGGPRVNGSFASAGLIDQVFWTLAPKAVGGGDAPHMFEGEAIEHDPKALNLLSIHENEGELYLRYEVATKG